MEYFLFAAPTTIWMARTICALVQCWLAVWTLVQFSEEVPLMWTTYTNATKLIAKRLDLLSSQELQRSDIGVWDRDLAEKRVAHKLELREGRAKAAAKNAIKQLRSGIK